MDEVGRGTSFRDGLSIAWAIMLHLHVVRHVRTLFATHYHELAEMIARDPRMAETVAMWRTRVVQGDPILFTHQLERGASRNSYGIHVARLAGLPPDVIATAEKTLKEMSGDKNV